MRETLSGYGCTAGRDERYPMLAGNQNFTEHDENTAKATSHFSTKPHFLFPPPPSPRAWVGPRSLMSGLVRPDCAGSRLGYCE